MRALNQFHRFSICLIWEIKGVWSAILKITYPESISATQPHWAIISGNAYSWKHLAVCGHSRTGFHCWRTALETHMLHVDLCHEYSDSRSMRVVVVVLVAQSCPALCDPMQSPPGSSVHGILQARILKWVAIPFSRRSSQSRNQIWVSHSAGKFFTVWATREAPTLLMLCLHYLWGRCAFLSHSSDHQINQRFLIHHLTSHLVK